MAALLREADVPLNHQIWAESRHARQHVEPEVATLKLALAEIAPFYNADRLTFIVAHRHRISVDQVQRENMRRSAIELVRLIELQVPRSLASSGV